MARRKHLVQIVDDDAASQRVLRVMLEADGFRVVTSDICMGGELEATSRPPDAMIVGMYQQFGDQVGENAGLVRELCAASR